MLFPNERPVFFDIGDGYQKRYHEKNLWYARHGLFIILTLLIPIELNSYIH